ncbi:hypothetical protein BVU76_18045 [Mycolicibacterium porcinum]|nr:hypothetical protein BVU76_18045 [Mycolicibacterium porcinum]
MEMRLRPYATAGIALAGAGVIAITPVAPPPTGAQVSSPAVNLSAAVNPIAPWIDVLNNSSTNATGLVDAYFEAPAPILQQVIVNQAAYLGQVLNDPGAIGDVLSGIGDNLEKVFQVATFLGLPEDTNTVELFRQSNDPYHADLAVLLPIVLPFFMPDLDENTVTLITNVIRFISSPASGVLIGLAGPAVSPVVALVNSVQAITGATDFESAVQALIATPANVVDGFLNGATLSLNPLLPLISGALPEGISLTSLNIAFGGLLTPGATGGDYDEEGTPYTTGIGGSIFNSVGLDVDFGLALHVQGHAVGPLGALTNLSQMIAKALGWDGAGNPLTELTFPTIDPPAAPDTTLLKQPAAVSDPDQGPKSLLNAKIAAPASNHLVSTGVADDEVATSDAEAQGQPAPTGEESGDGGAPGAPKVTTSKHRENPLRKAGTAVREGSDQVRRNVADFGKKLARDLKAPKKSMTKASTAGGPAGSEK